MLIALALISLIVTLLFGAIRLGNRSWNSVERHVARSDEMRLVWRFLGTQIGQARLVFQGRAANERRQLFSGRPDALELVAPSPPHMGVGGLYLMRLHTGQGQEKKRLLMSRWLYHLDALGGAEGVPGWRPLYDGGGDPPAGEEETRSLYTQTVLVDRLESMTISYFGVRGGGREPEWDDVWEDKRKLPLLVKIQIKDADGSWPEMVWALPDGQVIGRGGGGASFLPAVGGGGR
jgi:general secretion pathway protein J